MIFELKARIRHWFGKHTPVKALRDPSIWCWVCGINIPAEEAMLRRKKR